MSAQDKLENILREIHVMFAASRHLKNDENQILVDKRKVFQLLNQLNIYVYEMMDEQEVTQASKDKIRREAQRKGDRMLLDAEKKAEDIYAASVMYTNESLHHVQEAIDRASDEVEAVLKRTQDILKGQKETIRENQLELTEQLQDMADAKTYFRLIEERNRQIEKEKEEARKERELMKETFRKGTAAAKPEVKVNKAYFERTGMSLSETSSDEGEAKQPEIPEVTVNYDSPYFKWKQGQEDPLDDINDEYNDTHNDEYSTEPIEEAKKEQAKDDADAALDELERQMQEERKKIFN